MTLKGSTAYNRVHKNKIQDYNATQIMKITFQRQRQDLDHY